jgi:hypothetical protein
MRYDDEGVLTASCGKALLRMEFLVHRATQYNEPGVFMAFEKPANISRGMSAYQHDARVQSRQVTHG